MSDLNTPAPVDFPSMNDLMADLTTESASPASEVPDVVDTPQEVIPETPVVDETPEPEPEEPTLTQVTLYELKADGKTEQLDLDELKRRASAGTNYTRRSMEMAERERQLAEWQRQKEAELQAHKAQLDQNWRDENALALQYQRIQEAKQQQTQQPAQPAQQIDPQQFYALAAQTAREQAQAVLYEQQMNAWKESTQSDVNRHAKDLIKQHDILADVEDIDVLLRRDAGKLVERDRLAGVATSVDKVKEYMTQAAQVRVSKLQTRIKNSEQAAIMRHAKAQKPAIEPKGGNIPAVQTPIKNKWGDGSMQKQIEQDLLAELRSR